MKQVAVGGIILSAVFYMLFSSMKVFSRDVVASERFCVQTINTFGPFYSFQISERMRLILQYLGNNPCDVVVLQEVWLENHREKLSSGLKNLGYNVVDFNAVNPQVKQYGLITAFKGEAHSVKFIEFNENYSGFFDFFRMLFGVAKGFGVVNFVATSRDLNFSVYNTHLHHASESIRLSQTRQLIAHIKENTREDTHLILAGDFNFERNSLEFSTLKELIDHGATLLGENNASDLKLKGSGVNPCTYCSENSLYLGGGDREIDYVFFGKSSKVILRDYLIEPKKVSGKFISDHYGVKVIVFYP